MKNKILSAAHGEEVEFFYVKNPKASGGFVNGDDSKILIWNEHSQLLDIEVDPYGSIEDVRAVTRTRVIRFTKAGGLLQTVTEERHFFARPFCGYVGLRPA